MADANVYCQQPGKRILKRDSSHNQNAGRLLKTCCAPKKAFLASLKK